MRYAHTCVMRGLTWRVDDITMYLSRLEPHVPTSCLTFVYTQEYQPVCGPQPSELLATRTSLQAGMAQKADDAMSFELGNDMAPPALIPPQGFEPRQEPAQAQREEPIPPPAKRQRPRRDRICKFCGDKVEEKGHLKHEKNCCTTLERDAAECDLVKIRPLAISLENPGKRVVAVIGGLPDNSALMKNVQKMEHLFTNEIEQASSQGGVRKHHGFMAAIGWSHRWNRPHSRNSALAHAMGHALFLEAYQKSKVIKEYLRHAPDKKDMLARNLQLMRDDPAKPSAPNLYWSKNYSRGKDVHHDPPQALRQVMNEWGAWVAGCNVSCSTCREQGCQRCVDCTLHHDVADKGITILIMYQQVKVTNPGAVHLCLGSSSFSCAGGLIAVFDGRSLMHGVYGRLNDRNSHLPWWGCALVCVE